MMPSVRNLRDQPEKSTVIRLPPAPRCAHSTTSGAPAHDPGILDRRRRGQAHLARGSRRRGPDLPALRAARPLARRHRALPRARRAGGRDRAPRLGGRRQDRPRLADPRRARRDRRRRRRRRPRGAPRRAVPLPGVGRPGGGARRRPRRPRPPRGGAHGGTDERPPRLSRPHRGDRADLRVTAGPAADFPDLAARAWPAGGYSATPFALRMFQTFSGVIGISMWVTPRWARASTTALAIAGGAPTVADSPTPLAPSGWCGEGVTVLSVSHFGVSIAVGRR